MMWLFFDRNATDKVKKYSSLLVMSEEKIRKIVKCQFFFLSDTFPAHRRTRQS